MVLAGPRSVCMIAFSATRPVRCAAVIASTASCALMCGAIAYPISSLLHRSRAVARYSQPSPVGKQLMSPINFSPGIGAVNSRRTRSGTATAPLWDLVRFRRLRRVIPEMPFACINLETTRRPTSTPWRLSSRVMRPAPYAGYAVWISTIRTVNSCSSSARACRRPWARTQP
jgi:hypothetical protein